MTKSNNKAETIAITGKGGVGKSTTAAMIISHLKAHSDGPVLALDADPDANLAKLLGLNVETTIGDLREDLLKNIKNFPAGMSKENYVEAGLHQIIVETDNLDLITMGRKEGPGCYCFINNLLRRFADDLLPSYRWMVMDNEAGIEHISRRTASQVDHLIVVLNENPLAIDCARRIDELLDELNGAVKNKYYILNTVRPERVADINAKMADLGLEYLGATPYDDVLEETIYRGEPVSSLTGGPAIETINEIMQKIGVH